MHFEAIYNTPNLLDIELNISEIYSPPAIINKFTWYWIEFNQDLQCTSGAPAIIINKVSWYWIEFKLVFYFEASYNGPNLIDIEIE